MLRVVIIDRCYVSGQTRWTPGVSVLSADGRVHYRDRCESARTQSERHQRLVRCVHLLSGVYTCTFSRTVRARSLLQLDQHVMRWWWYKAAAVGCLLQSTQRRAAKAITLLTRNSAVAERPRVLRGIKYSAKSLKVAQGYSKWHPSGGRKSLLVVNCD